jgi:hypothetical protein
LHAYELAQDVTHERKAARFGPLTQEQELPRAVNCAPEGCSMDIMTFAPHPGDAPTTRRGLDWQSVQDFFSWDGSWRDLYVFNTTVSDWDRLLGALAASSFQVEFRRDSERASLPQSLAHHFNARAEQPVLLLIVRVQGLELHAHMFDEDEIEFDFDPREVASPEALAALHRFMSFVANTLGKQVALTPENLPERAFMIARPLPSDLEPI